MVVFLTITTVGFGVSINKLSRTGNLRAVASQVEISDNAANSSSRSGILTMEFGCIERSAGIRNNDVTQGAVRLKGKFCDLPKQESKEALSTMKIKNLTTGQESMLFLSGSDAFVTDGMHLKTGKNVFTMEWQNNNAQKELRAEVYGR